MTDLSRIPAVSGHIKRIEDCADDGEFLASVEAAEKAGELGTRNSEEVAHFIARSGIYSPRRIAEYMDAGMDPDAAWQADILREPEDAVPHVLELLSPSHLESACRKARIRYEVMKDISEHGLGTPEAVCARILRSHGDLDAADVYNVLNDLGAAGIIG